MLDFVSLDAVIMCYSVSDGITWKTWNRFLPILKIVTVHFTFDISFFTTILEYWFSHGKQTIEVPTVVKPAYVLDVPGSEIP
jgi:hypothetical protein